MNRRGMLATALAAGGSWARCAQAQDQTGRPVTLMHGFGPGGPADGIARLVAGPIGAALRQTVVVEPRPGAGGNIAAAALSRAASDGSVLGLVTGGHAVTAAFGRNQNYEPVDGFEPIAAPLPSSLTSITRCARASVSSAPHLSQSIRRPTRMLDLGRPEWVRLA
jgi:tripartite-type tricarboxylate transporter receptor subunit TctC